MIEWSDSDKIWFNREPYACIERFCRTYTSIVHICFYRVKIKCYRYETRQLSVPTVQHFGPSFDMIEWSDSDENGLYREVLGCAIDVCLAILWRIDLCVASAIANENRNVTKHISLKCAYGCWLNLHPTHSTPLSKSFRVLIWIGPKSNSCLTYQFSHPSWFSLNLGQDCLKDLSPLSTFLDNYAKLEEGFAMNQSSIPTVDVLAIIFLVVATFWTIAITIRVGFGVCDISLILSHLVHIEGMFQSAQNRHESKALWLYMKCG